jgi:predicted RNase H-like HicB family nuclease
MSVELPFSMVIRWSDVDRLYVAHLPEFGEGAKTHGSTYEEAVKNAREVLEMLVESYMADGQPMPKPQKYVAPRTHARRASSKKKQLVKQG